MTWSISFTAEAERDFRKLAQSVQRRIGHYLLDRISTAENPRSFGKPLQFKLASLWRYRVGDYRVLCRFEEDELLILVVEVGHRSTIYNS